MMSLGPCPLGLLDVREVGGDGPRDFQMQRLARAVRDEGVDIEPSRANLVGDANINRTFGNAVAVGVLFVASLTRSAAAPLHDLRMHVVEGERVGGNGGGFARPRRVAVDTELQCPEEPRLAEVVTREPLVLRAL